MSRFVEFFNTYKIILILILISVLYFGVFWFPNTAASENIEMVAVFEPDEAVPFPALLDMIKPALTAKEALINFAFYDYYFYGYPVFGLSALLLLPIKWAGQLSNMPLVMGVLRQMISVLPMILAIWVLVYLRTRFKDYRAVFLLVFLLSIPAVVQNNFWWHPDSLAILFAMLVLFFLDRDGLAFGKDFYVAAVFCGFSAGTKGIGFYFFLTIFFYLLIGLFGKKINLKKAIFAGAAFLLIMGLGYLFANPILIYESVRTRYFSVMQAQSTLLYFGYEVFYEKGIMAALPAVRQYYGSVIFLLLVVSANIYGIMAGKKRLLDGLILTWFLPLTMMVFFISHFKYQYWLPAFLPLVSSVTEIFPQKSELHQLKDSLRRKKLGTVWVKFLLLMFVFMQLIGFIVTDINLFQKRLTRLENEPAIQFYEKSQEVLAPYLEESLHVYHDVRMYMPKRENWYAESAFEMLNYDYISQKDFDVLFLMQQRIYDYLNPNLTAIDVNRLNLARQFYGDANQGGIPGYVLLYRDAFGQIYLKQEFVR